HQQEQRDHRRDGVEQDRTLPEPALAHQWLSDAREGKRRSTSHTEARFTTITRTVSSVAIAAPNGQSNTVRICSSTSVPSIFAKLPPSSAGVTNELAVSENTNVAPTARPGTLSGSVTRRNTANDEAPSVRAASSTAGLILPREAESGSTIIGRNTCTEPMITAHSVYSSCT